MDQPKQRSGLLFFICSIPFFYFLIVNKTTSSSSDDIKPPNETVKKETKESSTQTLSEYNDITIEESKSKEEAIISTPIVTEIDVGQFTETKPAESRDSQPSKRILDYFAYFVSGNGNK